MSDSIIEVEGLGKVYRIHHELREPYTTLRDAVAKRFANLFRPHQIEAHAAEGNDEFWALKDVSFDVKQGDIVGIVGRNGAGKSTLLKILSRITEPTTGRIGLNGRVSSLLEVGTGFHPELTGRENVFMNGSILGMTHREVQRKFDEIVAFAEVERFIDTPVKRYSSGMYMRLAFAVAAHMEPEILIIDEVLAVGDAEFQKKCLGRMGKVSSDGRTVLFVSHNIGALLSICKTGLYLDSGSVMSRGGIEHVVEAYRKRNSVASIALDAAAFRGPLRSVKFDEILLNGLPIVGHQCTFPEQGMKFLVRGNSSELLEDFRTAFALYRDGGRVLSLHDGPEQLKRGRFETEFTIPPYLLRPGDYWLAIGGSRNAGRDWTWAESIACVEVIARWGPKYDSDNEGILNIPSGATRNDVVARVPAIEERSHG